MDIKKYENVFDIEESMMLNDIRPKSCEKSLFGLPCKKHLRYQNLIPNRYLKKNDINFTWKWKKAQKAQKTLDFLFGGLQDDAYIQIAIEKPLRSKDDRTKKKVVQIKKKANSFNFVSKNSGYFKTGSYNKIEKDNNKEQTPPTMASILSMVKTDDGSRRYSNILQPKDAFYATMCEFIRDPEEYSQKSMEIRKNIDASGKKIDDSGKKIGVSVKKKVAIENAIAVTKNSMLDNTPKLGELCNQRLENVKDIDESKRNSMICESTNSEDSTIFSKKENGVENIQSRRKSSFDLSQKSETRKITHRKSIFVSKNNISNIEKTKEFSSEETFNESIKSVSDVKDSKIICNGEDHFSTGSIHDDVFNFTQHKDYYRRTTLEFEECDKRDDIDNKLPEILNNTTKKSIDNQKGNIAPSMLKITFSQQNVDSSTLKISSQQIEPVDPSALKIPLQQIEPVDPSTLKIPSQQIEPKKSTSPTIDILQNRNQFAVTKKFLVKTKKMPSPTEIEKIVQKFFEIYDTDQSGELERDEIKILLNDAVKEMGAPPITEKELDETIKTVDENGDGVLQLHEVYKILGPMIQQILQSYLDQITSKKSRNKKSKSLNKKPIALKSLTPKAIPGNILKKNKDKDGSSNDKLYNSHTIKPRLTNISPKRLKPMQHLVYDSVIEDKQRTKIPRSGTSDMKREGPVLKKPRCFAIKNLSKSLEFSPKGFSNSFYDSGNRDRSKSRQFRITDYSNGCMNNRLIPKSIPITADNSLIGIDHYNGRLKVNEDIFDIKRRLNTDKLAMGKNPSILSNDVIEGDILKKVYNQGAFRMKDFNFLQAFIDSTRASNSLWENKVDGNVNFIQKIKRNKKIILKVNV